MKKFTVLLLSGFLLLICSITTLGYLFLFDGDDMDSDQESGFYVYSEPVQSSDECTKYEEYNSEEESCFFECDTEKECDEIEENIYKELDNLESEYSEFSESLPEYGDSDGDEEEAYLIYDIQEDESLTIIKGEETDPDYKVKNWFKKISPDEFSDLYISRILMYKDEGGDTAAFVTPSSEEGKWDMYVNMDVLSDGDKEMIFTLIHEFAHILSLNSQQVDPSVSQSSCSNYSIEEGCALKDSYIQKFYSDFWDTRYSSTAESSPSELYSMNQEHFVSEYAATNPVEDFAESFAFFTFEKPDDDSTLSNQKILFFYDYPELESMRNDIRDTLKVVARQRIVQ